jgi:uncharacterized membrane protein
MGYTAAIMHPAPRVVVVIVILLPLLLLGLSVPMVLGRVQPNLWYGVRTPKTLASKEIWYRANRLGGVYLIVATLIALAVWGLLAFIPLNSALRAPLCILILVASTTIAMAMLMARLRRM